MFYINTRHRGFGTVETETDTEWKIGLESTKVSTLAQRLSLCFGLVSLESIYRSGQLFLVISLNRRVSTGQEWLNKRITDKDVSIKSQLTLSKYWVWFFSSQYQYQYQFLIVNISTPNKSYCFYIFFHTVTFLTLNSYYLLLRCFKNLFSSLGDVSMFIC